MRTLRGRAIGVLLLVLAAPGTRAAIGPETVTVETLGTPQSSWFIAKALGGVAHVFDAATGEMLGLLSLTAWTPAVTSSRQRGEIYAAESYYSRSIRGRRTDVLTVYDARTLAPVHEVELPPKVAAVLPFPDYISLVDDGRHLLVFNMTPAQSVSVVDVQSRKLIGEISTPGCALMLPVPDRGFLMLCGDGTLQLLRLDRQGRETVRRRSAPFFDVDEDPVFDRPVRTARGWHLTTFAGRAFDVEVQGDDIRIGAPWSLLDDTDRAAGWRPGGVQLAAFHEGLDVLAVIMHVGGPDTHEEPGEEIWLFDRAAQRRIARIEAGHPLLSIQILPTAEPLLLAAREDGQIDIRDLRSTRLVRSIEKPGLFAQLLQTF